VEIQSPPSGNGTLTLTYGTGTVNVTISYDLAASSKMYTAIKKTTWGVAATSGGPTVLDAWEALVWGSKTYCSFVMFAPPGATFAGVAGFMKAIWRWNAPVTMSMDIGQIGGGQTVKTYKGMNNVADLWRRGLVSDKAHIGGELALITATTNNIGVSADFSGWVAGTSGRGLRLAGVDGIPAFNEGGYLAIDTGSGTVAILLRMKSETYFIAKNPSRCTEWDCDAYIPFENLSHLGRAYDANPTRVVPKRCAGWAYLASTGRILRSAIPAGKCDDYLKYGSEDGFVEDRGSSARSWMEAFPDYYQEPIVGAYLTADGPDYDYTFNNGKPVLAETFIFLNEAAY
jgi:hypothetical protein